MDTPEHKYFRTYHLPHSMATTSDDKILSQSEVESYFCPMVDAYASIKYDGECTTIGRGYSHARSLDSKDHWSRHHIKHLAASLYQDIEPGWRICGENMLATHSIRYTDLESFFYVFSVWDNTNTRLSLDEMKDYCGCLGLTFTKVLERGSFLGMNIKKHFDLDFEKDEGYVLSNAGRFHYDDARKNIAKVVRKGHVQTEDHWMHTPERFATKNLLKS
jgi:hypothetical protein